MLDTTQTEAHAGGRRLHHKVILVVGATSGIGRAVAYRVAAEGAAVMLAGRRQDLGQQAVAYIENRGGRAAFVRCDATVETDVAAAVGHCIRHFGRLNGAVNNAGGVVATGPIANLRATDWEADLASNLTSVFYGLKHQLPAIHDAGGGAVINNASSAGVSAVPGLAAYSAAKHGVVGLTRSAALEWAERRVRVNAIITGNVDTPLYRELLGASPELPREDLHAPNPSNRVADPNEIAGLIAYVLTDEASFITGSAIAIDGGMTAQ